MDCCFWVSVCASVSNMGIKKIRSSAEVTLNKSGEVHKSNVDPENKYSLPSGLWWEKKHIFYHFHNSYTEMFHKIRVILKIHFSQI